MIILKTQLLPVTRIRVLEAYDDNTGPLTITALLQQMDLDWCPQKYQVVEQTAGVIIDPKRRVSEGECYFVSLRLLHV